MALTELKGKVLGTQTVIIERGPVKVFAQALVDDDPVYTSDTRRSRRRSRSSCRTGVRWARAAPRVCRSRTCGARAARSCTASRNSSSTTGSWPHVGDVLVGDGVIADVYEKERSDGGKLEFYVTETTWKNEQTGDPVVTTKFTLTIVCKPDAAAPKPLA